MRIWNARYETVDAESIQALQLRKLRSVLNHAWATNRFYREKFVDARVMPDDIRTLDDYTARIPTIGKADFIKDQAANPPFGSRHEHVLGLGTSLFVYTTSGTSGQGQEVHIQTSAEFTASDRDVYPYLFRWAGLLEGDALFLAMPVSMLGGGRIEYHGALEYGLTVYPVGNYDAPQKVELMRRFQPQALLANTSYLGRLGTVATEKAERAHLKAVITGGEGSSLAWLHRLEETWGASVFDRYGCSQTGNDHMFMCEQGVGDASRPGILHNIDPMMLIEVIDPETGRRVADGEDGELVLTSLYRLDSPLIRCRVGDRAVFREAQYCGCGRPFRGVEAASISRVDDGRKIKGVLVWPQAVDEVLFTVQEISEYQVVLSTSADGLDVVTVRAMPSKRLDPSRTRQLASRIGHDLHRKIGIHVAVEILAPGDIQLEEWKARRWIDERRHMREVRV